MAHHLVDDPEFGLSEPEGCRRLVNFLVQLQLDMMKLTFVFHGFEQAFLTDIGVDTVASLRDEHPEIFEFIDSLGYELLRRDA